ncbi:hypothetical protein U27_00862 [Candidatus Vecturithrix granuli]|uniref:Uncharacterized protein n=1 Tax=Vecturithrix granuli TaxID=1499967 RepID=A0A081C8Q9_VECG1|nr:hypothetical protein U27_00862 [Candidatus Vecturithrix granuli]
MTRRTWYRLIALAFVVVLAVFLFWIGKGHTLLLDNKEIKRDGQKLKAERLVQVIINDQEPVEVKSGIRKAAKDVVAGPWHSIKIEVLDRQKNVVKTVEKKFSLGLNDMFVLSIPALLAENADWIEPFEPPKRS